MDANLKKILRSLSLELRHVLEGWYDDHDVWHPGDLERRLNELGVCARPGQATSTRSRTDSRRPTARPARSSTPT